MTIDVTSPFRLGTEISRSTFTHELKKKDSFTSPLWNGIDDPPDAARKIYDLIVGTGHSAEVWLAIAGGEHTWGTNSDSVLHRNDTRSWTNARSIRHPGIIGEIITDSVRGSNYVKYPNVIDSVRDGIYRIDDPTYAYAGLTSIIDIMLTWTEGGGAEFAEFIVDYVIGVRSRETPVNPGGDMPHVAWIPADSRHFTRGRRVDWPEMIILHHTDGWDSLHWLTKSPNSNVSATYLLNRDGTPRAQLVRHHDTPHTTGDWNDVSLSVEWERKWTGTTSQRHVPDDTYANIGRHVADMVRVERRRGNPHFSTFTPSQLRDHNDFYDTICPGNLDTSIVYEIAAADLKRKQPKPDARYFKETGKRIVHGFKGFWEELEDYNDTLTHRTIGLPLTHEGDAIMPNGDRKRVQFFERAVLVWNEGAVTPWHITAMHREDVDKIVAFDEDKVA